MILQSVRAQVLLRVVVDRGSCHMQHTTVNPARKISCSDIAALVHLTYAAACFCAEFELFFGVSV